MTIRGWSIDGFGAMHGAVVDGLPDGLAVIHGANEAGKSTLLEFLRAVLFGAAGNGTAPPYAPLAGGRHGGRVRIAAADGEYVIERALDRAAPARITRPDGRAGDATDLERLLGGADARLFRAVFACGLDDLAALAGGDADVVRERLFSASLTGAGRSARAAMHALRTQAAERLNGEGAARINTLIAELEALRPRLNGARRAALAYGERCLAMQRATASVAPLRAALAARRARHERDAALRAARPVWDEIAALHATLAALPPAPPSAPGFAAELSLARQAVDAALRHVQTLRDEEADAERLARALHADRLGRAAAEVEALCAELTMHRYHLATLPAARGRCDEAERARCERLGHLGPDWDVERLRQWARTGVDRDAARDWQMRLRAADERVAHAQWRLDAASAQRAALGTDVPPPPAPAGAAELEQQRRALEELRGVRAEMLERRGRGEATALTLRERERALRGLDVEAYLPPSAWLAAGWWGGAAVAAAGAIGAAMLGHAALAALLVGGAAASAVGIARLQRLAHWNAARELQRQAQRRTVRSELEAARRARDTEWHRANELAGDVARAAAELGLSRSPSAAELDAADHALAERAVEAERLAAAHQRALEQEPLRRRVEAEEQTRRSELTAALAAQESAASEWAAWCAAGGFAADAGPDTVLERVGLLALAQAADAACATTTRELRQIEPLVAAWEARARALLGRRGDRAGVALGGDALIERVLALRATDAEMPPSALDAELESRRARLRAAEEGVTSRTAAFEALLRAAGVRDEAELAESCRRHEHRAALERDLALREQRLGEGLGWSEAMAELAGDPVEWMGRLAAADGEIAALAQRLAQGESEVQRAEQACRTLEESSEVPSLELEWDGLMTELAGAVSEWRVLAVAEGLIDAARGAFEQSRQPAVLRDASGILAAITGGRYVRIAQDDRGDGLIVIDRDGGAKRVGHELSRGTLEQLYLSLRLGLAAELTRRGTALPLVLDDVLVNFDPARARAMAGALGAFARNHQVLFFTCHPATRDLLREQAGAACLVELGSAADARS